MNKDDREDYLEMLENLSDMQVLQIYKRDAGRKDYAALAYAEMEKRGLT